MKVGGPFGDAFGGAECGAGLLFWLSGKGDALGGGLFFSCEGTD